MSKIARGATGGARPLKTLTGLLLLLMIAVVEGAQCHASRAGQRAAVAAGSPGSMSPAATAAGQEPGQSAEGPAAIFRQGRQALQGGDLAGAAEDFRRVIALDPRSGAAHIDLGVTYMRQKRWEEALAELKKAQPLSPEEPGIQLNIGLVYYRQNEFDSAIAPFSATLRSEPDSPQARYLLGLCYFFTNRYSEAADTLEPLWDREKANLNYLYVLSIAASKSTRAALQKQAFDQMLAVGQGSPEFHLYVGKAWLAEDDTGKALEEFRAAAAARPGLPTVHYFLGRTYLERREFPQAEAELEKDAALEPEFAYDYEDLGMLYVLLNQQQMAEANFRKAIERNSTLVNSYFGLAKLYREESRFKESLEMLDRSATLAPNSAGVHYMRGQVLKSLGRQAAASQEFQTADRLFKSFHDHLQQDRSGDRFADAQDAAQE